MTDEPESLENHRLRMREKRAKEKIDSLIKPALEGWDEHRRQKMDYMARAFGIDVTQEPNSRVLSKLLFACEEPEEPPFKLVADIGWLWRAYCLAQAERHEDWPAQAARMMAEAMEISDDLSQHDYETMQSLFGVPDEEHAELQRIVEGLSLFSDRRELHKPARYLQLVRAIVEASGIEHIGVSADP